MGLEGVGDDEAKVYFRGKKPPVIIALRKDHLAYCSTISRSGIEPEKNNFIGVYLIATILALLLSVSPRKSINDVECCKLGKDCVGVALLPATLVLFRQELKLARSRKKLMNILCA